MHPEALTKNAEKLFPKLDRFKGFYLAGGTALALQIGHRVSVDFDLFTRAPIMRSLLAKVKKVFSGSVVKDSVNNSGELTVSIDGVKCTFLRYPYAVKQKTIAYRGVPILSIADIAVTKAYTIGRRGDFKDYVDMHYILKEEHTTLHRVIARSQKAYGDDFNDRLFLEQLTYLDDIKETNIAFLKHPVTRSQLGAFFRGVVKEQGMES